MYALVQASIKYDGEWIAPGSVVEMPQSDFDSIKEQGQRLGRDLVTEAEPEEDTKAVLETKSTFETELEGLGVLTTEQIKAVLDNPKFNSIDDLDNASVNQLTKIKHIGKATAKDLSAAVDAMFE
jgi:ERCC4-type nuclease